VVRPTYVEVDLAAIAHNVAAFRDLVGPSLVCAVVKADGYGHGDVPVAEAALEAGASWLAVALLEEGVRLREAGIAAPILLLSEPGLESVAEIVEWGLTPTVYTLEFVDALGDSGRPIGIHIKIDTGMHRVGAPPALLPNLLAKVRGNSNLELEALWTHFAVADEDRVFTERQIEMFDGATAGIEVPLVHMANTAGAVLFPEARAGMCRIGIGTYGIHPCPATREKIELRPAMRLASQVTHLQRLESGARPSYGRIRELAEESTVATVPMGYADGFSRARTGDVLIGGRRHPLAGRVTMDQIVVDVGDDEVTLGDEVVLLGPQEDEEISADEWADEVGTISYEVVCTIGSRVPRRYQG
jgi:alanine racemase